MDSNKSLGRAGYLVAFMLVVLPLFDATTSVWPLHLGDERWRFGAIGTLSNIMLVPVLGLLLGLAVAVLMDHRRIQRFLGWISALLAVAIAILAVLFILDYFQTRTIVNPRFQSAVSTATTAALLKHVLSILALILLTRAGFSGPKPLARRKQVPITEPVARPLIPLTGTAPAE